ncbi:MAG: hypothetical protein IPN82_15970 [Chitinophagaceae bacterium]|nr:hypothetical protein [Chitinophagaceae bacterium]
MRFFKALIASLAFFLSVAQTVLLKIVLEQLRTGLLKVKIADGKYELIFSGNINGNWQVYAPNQTILEIKTTELQFADSSIVQIGDFVLESTPKEINSAILENTKVSVLKMQLNGKLLYLFQAQFRKFCKLHLFYTYGINDEFYPSTLVPITTKLEGGVKAASIKIPSIDVNNPVSDCGDDGTKIKVCLAFFFWDC